MKSINGHGVKKTSARARRASASWGPAAACALFAGGFSSSVSHARHVLATGVSSAAAIANSTGTPTANSARNSTAPSTRTPNDARRGGVEERALRYCFEDPHGHLSGGVVHADLPLDPRATPVVPAPVTTVHARPSIPHPLAPPTTAGSVPTNRLDLVFVGDGYRAGQLDTYAERVDLAVAGWFEVEPYKSYASYYNVHRVDVVSNESGVDHAPTFGILKDTALDMSYWFQGIERALWVDVNKAWAFANNAPAADLVYAIARNQLHGGLTMTGTGVMTGAGGNDNLPQTVAHELGHGQGGLADEYFSLNGATYTGSLDFDEPNASRLDEVAMAATNQKWARWLAVDDERFDGLVGTFEGAHYYQFGAFRPTANSLMRNLWRPFNPPSAEALVLSLYQWVRPIEAHADTNQFHDESSTLWVQPMRPASHALAIEWTLDGAPIPGATGETLALCGIALPAGWHSVGVRVVDPTPLVRDEVARANSMAQTLFFVVHSAGSEGVTPICDGAPNSVGAGARLAAGGTTSLGANDFVLTVSEGPATQPGSFFTASSAVSLPFGDGTLCLGGGSVRFPVTTLDAGGGAELALDWTALPGGLDVTAGERRLFQFWYRDPGGPGGTGFNLSSAIGARLCP